MGTRREWQKRTWRRTKVEERMRTRSHPPYLYIFAHKYQLVLLSSVKNGAFSAAGVEEYGKCVKVFIPTVRPYRGAGLQDYLSLVSPYCTRMGPQFMAWKITTTYGGLVSTVTLWICFLTQIKRGTSNFAVEAPEPFQYRPSNGSFTTIPTLMIDLSTLPACTSVPSTPRVYFYLVILWSVCKDLKHSNKYQRGDSECLELSNRTTAPRSTNTKGYILFFISQHLSPRFLDNMKRLLG